MPYKKAKQMRSKSRKSTGTMKSKVKKCASKKGYKSKR